MGFFLFSMILFGAASRFVNGSLCVNVRHTVRIGIVTVFTFCSFLMIALACIKGSGSGNKSLVYFVLAVFASIFTGISQSFGEAAIMGFLKGYPSEMIGHVSSGTGFAGIMATSTILGGKALGLSNQFIFIVEAPLIFIYFFLFRWLDRQRKIYKFVEESDDEINRQTEESSLDDDNREGLANQSLNLTTIRSLLPRCYFLTLNLFSVYFLEYSCITAFA